MVEINKNKRIRIEDLYPGQTAEWYARAERNLKRYAEILWHIHQRLKDEGKDRRDSDA